MDFITSQGMTMPKLGLGTWRMKGAECVDAVQRAIGLGYRHIDTAEMYGNEEAVGEAVANAGVPRSELHVTTKVWYENLGADAMQRSIEASLQQAAAGPGGPVPDPLAVPRHGPAGCAGQPDARARSRAWPAPSASRTSPWRCCAGRVEEIGAPIACNQVEYHVLLGQPALVDYAAGQGVGDRRLRAPGAGPARRARGVAGHRRASTAPRPAQVALKWLLDQPGVAAIPKANRAEAQQANLDALRIELDDTDRAVIAMLPKTQRFVNPGWAPVWDQAA